MMKLKDINKILKANKKISDYEIISNKKESSELFFVLKKLELNRATLTENISIKIYVDVKDLRGSSTILVTSADDEKSLNKKINEAIKKAKAALNKHYPLVINQKKIDNKLAKKEDLNELAKKVGDAILKADHYKKGWINSTEVFVSRTTLEFINSKGVKQKEERLNIEFEIIPTWSNEKEEFELYKYYKSNKLDSKAITEEVEEILNLAKQRSSAVKLRKVKVPKGTPVLIQGEMADLIVKTIMDNASYMSKFMHQNHYELKDEISNNKFDLTLKSNIKGCFNSRSFDTNGVTLSSKKLIKEGKLINNYGDIRFGYYLLNDVNKISGDYSVCQISNYDTFAYKRKPHIIIDHFSSPQMEADSGYFGGEVRLARYFDGKKYIPLTSFTLSGNIYDALKDVTFSKEETITSLYKGPKYFIFDTLKLS